MSPMRMVSLALCVAAAVTGVALCQFAPPKAQPPEPAVLKQIEERTQQLAQKVDRLKERGIRDPLLADVEIFLKAAQWIVKHGEFYNKDAAAWTLAVLDHGLLRASQQGRGEAPWLYLGGTSVVRAYRSQVDGSLQPYAVTYPAGYGEGKGRTWRLDVVLHGRNPSLTEVAFLHQNSTGKPAPKDQNFVRLDIFGRGNNAYRWAGESDVIEAVDTFLAVERELGQAQLLDPARCVLRGFSMGGAGTWHLGLHRPDRWCVIGPGAGFTSTHGYVKDLPETLAPHQEACLKIYDAVDYAENAAMVPVVAFSGSEDPQMQAARNIEQRLKPLGIDMVHIQAPGLGHSFPPEWQKKVEAELSRFVKQGRPSNPKKVRFVTYTLKYATCDWIEIIGLEKHYHKAVVDATEAEDGSYTVKTTNIRALALRLPPGSTRAATPVAIDGQQLHAMPYGVLNSPLVVYLEKRDGRWTQVLPEWLLTQQLRHPQKTTGLQGPIDDAFMGSFLCVRGSHAPWHAATGKYAHANLERFRNEWSRFLRGELPVKDDTDVTAEDLATRSLILFGDPSSNSLIAQALPALPLQWSREKITWIGKPYSAAEHVPVLIYPSPFNPKRYIVLNSGHTFHAADFLGTNALLYPRLGDHALLKLLPDTNDPLQMEPVQAGLFDEFWRFSKSSD